MDWQQITAITSVIGVAGGLISVFFLAYEIRRNAQAIEGTTVQSLMTLEAQVFSVLLDNAATYTRGCANDDDLSAIE